MMVWNTCVDSTEIYFGNYFGYKINWVDFTYFIVYQCNYLKS